MNASVKEDAGDCGSVITLWDTKRKRIQLATLAARMRRLLAPAYIRPTTPGLKLAVVKVLDLAA